MTVFKMFAAGATALALAGLPTVALAQATGKENNATSGSEPGAGPASKMSDKNDKGAGSKSSGMKEKEHSTSAGTSENQAEDLRGHSETPSTGAK